MSLRSSSSSFSSSVLSTPYAVERSRELEAMSTADQRIGGLGPALFCVIIIGILVLIMCLASGFIDDPRPRKSLRITACVLILVPLTFFTSVTYVEDDSELVSNRRVDETYLERVWTLIFLSIWGCCSILSLCAGDSSPLLMHRQGRNIQTTVGAKVWCLHILVFKNLMFHLSFLLFPLCRL